MKVSVKVDARQLHAALDKKLLQIQLIKTSELDKIGKEQVNLTQQRIRSSKTDPTGKPWAPWSVATLRQRQRQGNASRGLLYRTGALLTSIQYRVSNSVLSVFTNKPYATHLQFGTPKMPAREFIGWGNQINTILERIKDKLK